MTKMLGIMYTKTPDNCTGRRSPLTLEEFPPLRGVMIEMMIKVVCRLCVRILFLTQTTLGRCVIHSCNDISHVLRFNTTVSVDTFKHSKKNFL